MAGLTGRIATLFEGLGVADPQLSAVSLVAEMVGAVALSRAVADPAQSDAILASARRSVGERFGLEERQ